MKPAKTHTSETLQNFFNETDPLEYKKVDFKMTIAARIHDAIIKKRLRKKHFARLMNKHDSEISKWLSGTHNFTIDTLVEIEYYLGTELLNPKPKYCNPCNIKTIIFKAQ